MSACPPEVLALVERFQRNRDAYRSPAYNEAQARREFIDPLFKALGWDVDNTFGLAVAETPNARTALQRQIDATDRQIDQLVYELYGLTDDEIKIVVEATRA
jgi:hypothetical protein